MSERQKISYLEKLKKYGQYIGFSNIHGFVYKLETVSKINLFSFKNGQLKIIN